MIGQTIAYYTITEKIGQGGMGEVYRATDTKLKRDVALKVLPESFTQDPQRMARFTREAQVLASLNHPNIGAIHGLEQEGGVRALVLELIEGDDLSDRIAKGPIPLEEVLKIALQIAEALEAAHEKGIIHRDLKPANVKITPDGQVKVLDFGLAKAIEAEQGHISPGLSHSPTMTAAATEMGVILGTAGYMSPEQARGTEADKRSDIRAFGVILYEMLTGTRAYLAKTLPDTLANVLAREVEWEKLPARTPPSIRRLLRRCLTKDRKQRLHDIDDARSVIGDFVDGGEEADLGPETVRRPWGLAAGVVLGILVGALVMGLFPLINPTPSPEPTPSRSELVIDTQGLGVTAWQVHLAISPDGRQLVFREQEDLPLTKPLYLRSLTDRGMVPLRDSEGGSSPFFSPDGQWVGFFAGGKLKKVSLTGGAAEVLCDASLPFGGSWGPDHTIVFTPVDGESLWQVSASGGMAERVSTVDLLNGETAHSNPVILPDGSSVLFAINHGAGTASLGLLDLATREHKTLLAPLKNYGYPKISPDGQRIAVQVAEPGKTATWIVDRESGRMAKIESEGSSFFPFWTPDGARVTYQSDRSGPGQWITYWEKADGSGVAEPLFDARTLGNTSFDPDEWSPNGRLLIGRANLRKPESFTGQADHGNSTVYLDLDDPSNLKEVIPTQDPLRRLAHSLSPDGRCFFRQVLLSHDPSARLETEKT